jgi:3D (Asp-Asp-Asp) domain-containing protein
MRFLTLIIGLLFALVLVFNGLRPAEPVDPYEPAPGAYDGLTAEQITNLEAEREAARLIDEEVSRGGERIMTMEATAYTWTGNRTASGTWPAVGTAAVDPKVIPLGTRLWIEGYGEAVALDTGGDIQGQIIDLYMDSYQECIEWGRRQVEVRVME